MSEEEKKEDADKLKELMGLIFNLYCECDHTNWEKPLFKNEKIGDETQGIIAWLEKGLWETLVDLEDTFGLAVKEVEIDITSLIVENKKEEEESRGVVELDIECEEEIRKHEGK